MNKDNAKKTFKRVSTEALSLSPSALITLYEIDVKDIARDFTLNRTTDYDYSIPFRFHTNIGFACKHVQKLVLRQLLKSTFLGQIHF